MGKTGMSTGPDDWAYLQKVIALYDRAGAEYDTYRRNGGAEWDRTVEVMKRVVGAVCKQSGLTEDEFVELWEYACVEGKDPRERPWYPKIQSLFETGKTAQLPAFGQENGNRWKLHPAIRGACYLLINDILGFKQEGE